MSQKEAKTGQSVDIVKTAVLTPAIVEGILEIPNLGRELSLIDIGSGDATSSRGVIEALSEKGYVVANLGLADADLQVFPELLGTVTTEPSYAHNTQVLEVGDRAIVNAFLEHYEGKYDIALAQLVLHQIHSTPEISYLTYSAYRALKPDGELLFVDLHPKYIHYLHEHEPDKFETLGNENDVLTGKYHFDSGGSIAMYSREMPAYLSTFLSLGFDLVKAKAINTYALAEEGERHGRLAENDVPMFYLMQMRKNPAYFVSSTEGVVKAINPANASWISVAFADDQEIQLPRFSGWDEVKPGSELILHEIARPDAKIQVVNYWVANEGKVYGGQLVARQRK